MKTLAALEQTRSALKRLDKALAEAKKKNVAGRAAFEAEYGDELAAHKADLARWHAFKTDAVVVSAQALTKRTMETLEKVRAAHGSEK